MFGKAECQRQKLFNSDFCQEDFVNRIFLSKTGRKVLGLIDVTTIWSSNQC